MVACLCPSAFGFRVLLNGITNVFISIDKDIFKNIFRESNGHLLQTSAVAVTGYYLQSALNDVQEWANGRSIARILSRNRIRIFDHENIKILALECVKNRTDWFRRFKDMGSQSN